MNFSNLDCSIHGGNPQFSQVDSFCKNKDNYITFLIGHYLRFHVPQVGMDEEFAKVYRTAAEEEMSLRTQA